MASASVLVSLVLAIFVLGAPSARATTLTLTWTATTGSGGTVTFTWKNAPGDCYVTNVMNVSATGLNWNSGASSNTHTVPACKSDFPTVRP